MSTMYSLADNVHNVQSTKGGSGHLSVK
uniref:Uncharacterized protein n=1 Tax=Anguilla anguilla TaxID=7936 RepID=A0A0E9QED9_ANGAN